ncbi:Adenosylhomocysteinase [Streptomyces misionensis JCM 4497]
MGRRHGPADRRGRCRPDPRTHAHRRELRRGHRPADRPAAQSRVPGLPGRGGRRLDQAAAAALARGARPHQAHADRIRPGRPHLRGGPARRPSAQRPSGPGPRRTAGPALPAGSLPPLTGPAPSSPPPP